MPIITIRFIKDVVATPEQKKELLQKMTDTFVGVLGDVVRPYTYCLIEETPVGEWALAGVPLPDFVFLTGPKFAEMHQKAGDIMKAYMAAHPAPHAEETLDDKIAKADAQWRGHQKAELNSNGHSSNGHSSNGHASAPAGESKKSAKDLIIEAQNKAVIRLWLEEAWSKGNYSIASEVIDQNFMVHGAGGQSVRQGPDGVADLVRTWRNAFPDGKMSVDDLVSEGDKVVVRMTWTGTHTGEFYGIKPTGRKVNVSSIGIDRVVNGKITEGWGEVDMLGMMQQLGAVPAPAGA
jgi:4-oxalocrotonate tautomerase family enzyme